MHVCIFISNCDYSLVIRLMFTRNNKKKQKMKSETCKYVIENYPVAFGKCLHGTFYCHKNVQSGNILAVSTMQTCVCLVIK